MNIKNLKQMIKLAAFDVDGTLLPNASLKFSDKTKSVFPALKANGITTVVSTAREFATIGDFLEQLAPVDYFIGANGAFIWNNKEKNFLYKSTLVKEEVIDLYNKFKDQMNGFSVTDFNKVYKSPSLNLDSWFIKPFKHNYHNFEEAMLSRTDLFVITINCDNTRELSDQIEKYIIENNYEMEISARWTKGFFISPKNITKSNALEKLAKHLNLTMDNIIAFGDSSNDYEMIRDAGYGVAMERANDKIKRVANDVAIDCEYDGVYWKLKELKLI
ncbi:YcsE-related riboflavin metabolism phosphatase [Mycoplasmopsis glycophila]|uniref:COF family HAD hydrolase protein n=1 Tax=Mycoplasmopsis glycophila TaxID=171285 RepID=A0A449AUW8_9BACT|nr:HAD family hydrolase [Mycoplasmopsis glycophila]VEU70272.1 COF family HAD hydrolase protein [Mycoplasmopsis glycophila]